ncbi:hypothetical protein [Caldicellulosiruptor changbaiensis]|nr:hypothetical protein [Caldicellulosiruptor changbaiensis]
MKKKRDIKKITLGVLTEIGLVLGFIAVGFIGSLLVYLIFLMLKK